VSTVHTLGTACARIVDCEHKTAPIDETGEYFVVGTPAMRGNVINYGEARRVNKSTFDTWTRRLLPQSGDLLFAREAPVGPIVRIPASGNVAPGQRTVLFRPNQKIVDPDYLYYLLASPIQQDLISAKAAGSTVEHLNVADVRAFELPALPAVVEQRAIAEVLGALDNKIASNTELAATAEGLVAALFVEAVHRVELSESNFDEIAQVRGGGTPRTGICEYWDGDINWVTPTDVTALSGPYLESTSRRITKEGLEACASPLFPAGSILMTSRATIGAFAVAQHPTATNQGFIVVNPHDSSLNWWIFHEMKSRVDEFISLANGATFLELSRGNFKKFRVRLSDESTMKEFGLMADALHSRARQAFLENDGLADTRDSLLPHLMSGKIRVKEAYQMVGDVV